jgi:hypothetical protein
MRVNWNITSSEIGSLAEYICTIDSVAKLEEELEPLIIACTDKAVSMMHDNIDDHSQYLIFEITADGILKIVVTDDTKQREAGHKVICDMSTVEPYLAKSSHWKFKDERFADVVKFCLRDYLTTCSGFMRFSLVATFSEGDRTKTELL